MFATRLVQLIEAHADKLAEGLIQKLQDNPRCSELFRKLPPDELKTRTYEIYRNLDEWVLHKTESQIEERYLAIGIRRARQGVPFTHVYWAVTTTKEYLWEYLESEGLLEKPVELLGELDLLHHIERFFDRALYFAAVGYEKVRQEMEAHAAATSAVGR